MSTAQHGTLTAERWAHFPREQQVLMIANELHRAQKLLSPGDRARLQGSLERVLALVDLTAGLPCRRGFRRELLRWRDLVAAVYVSDDPSAAAMREAQRALLRFTPRSAAQIPHVVGAAL